MKKLLIALMCLSSALFASSSTEYDKELKKYNELRHKVLNENKETNEDVKRTYEKTHALSKELLNIVISEYPGTADLEAKARWAKLTEVQDQLISSNPKFKKLHEERNATYKEQGLLLRDLSQELDEQSQRLWEVKKAAQENSDF